MSLTSLILPPPGPGLLPKWLWLVSTVAFVQVYWCYTRLDLNKRVYSGRPDFVNALTSRTFGTWSMMQAFVRLFAAHHLAESAWYDLCLISFGVAAWHFTSEWFYFKTARFGPGIMSPIIVTSISIPWMLLQRSSYAR